MSQYFKSLMTISCLFILSFIACDFNQLEAACGRWGAYEHQGAAWGGNGGWWGTSHGDMYGSRGIAEEYNYYDNAPVYPSRRYHYHNNYYQHGTDYYNGSVDGGALYFNVR